MVSPPNTGSPRGAATREKNPPAATHGRQFGRRRAPAGCVHSAAEFPARASAVPRTPVSGAGDMDRALAEESAAHHHGEKQLRRNRHRRAAPARPFKFSVSPGDLSSDGIVLYTSNMQYANNVVEPPGAQNGWNKTVYTWNPKYANDASVVESPAQQNQWSRIVLRSKNPKISVIVIDWTLVN